ncbi:MAG: OmpA family protein [Alphaproteobacteria bacterium]
MAVIRNILFSILAVTVIAACAYRWDIKGVRSMEAKGTAFDYALKENFTDFAEVESTRGDWDETERYLIRARAAAEGMTVDPYYFYLRPIPYQVIDEVKTAYAHLVNALDSGAKISNPEVAAEAQISYECWIEALGENLFMDRMEACKGRYETAMSILEGREMNLSRDTAEFVKARKDAELAGAQENAFANGAFGDATNPLYVVYFGFNKTNVEPKFKKVISEASDAYKKLSPELVLVSGHADTVGSDKVNMIVSRNRANNVSKALNEAGVPKKKMDVRAFGEKQLAVQTGDNVREPRNRRVEIELTGIKPEVDNVEKVDTVGNLEETPVLVLEPIVQMSSTVTEEQPVVEVSISAANAPAPAPTDVPSTANMQIPSPDEMMAK